MRIYRALIAGLPRSAAQLVSTALFRALSRVDVALDKTLVPREPRMPALIGTGSAGRLSTAGTGGGANDSAAAAAIAAAAAFAGSTAATSGAEVQSSMISWRVEELGELNNGGLGATGGAADAADETVGAGFGGDIVSW